MKRMIPLVALCAFLAAVAARADKPKPGAGDAKAAAADKGKSGEFWKKMQEAEKRANDSRAAGFADLEKGAAELAAADHEQREARIFRAKALELEHADADRIKAWEARREAAHLWWEAHRKYVEAHGAELAAKHHEADAAELTKAAGIVKDQPSVVELLKHDATHQENVARHDREVAARLRAEGDNLKKQAEEKTAEARKDERAAHGLEVAAKGPQLKPHPQPPPSQATNAVSHK